MAKTLVKTLVQWLEPDGVTWHEPGEEKGIDTDRVHDLEDLIRAGVVVLVPEPPTESTSDSKQPRRGAAAVTAVNDEAEG
jgi:hypothetical protein